MTATKPKSDPFSFTKTDQPEPKLVTFWTLRPNSRTSVPLRCNCNTPVQIVTNYLRDATDPAIGEVSAGWSFLEQIMPEDDYKELQKWPMTPEQFRAVGARAFAMIAYEGDPPDGD